MRYFCVLNKMMTKLSVNINKIATLRNSRGGNVPNLVKVATDIQEFGAEGITIHPRPDERHIRYQDAYDLKPIVSTEYNIEGNPIDKFMQLVLAVKPTQVTLVPDGVNQLTSNAGWDTIKHQSYLQEVITEFKNNGIRTSIFIDTDLEICKTRDPKGLYAKAMAGEIKKFTGIDSKYERPDNADFVLNTLNKSPLECAQKIMNFYLAQ